MEFVFRPSAYDGPALEEETAELLRRRLEEYSRTAVPRLWRMTDRLNAQAAKGPGREPRRRKLRIYGVLLLALGAFAFVPGLMEPMTPGLIWAGGLAAAAGALEFWLAGEKKPLRPPASCRKEAAALLRSRQGIDWEKLEIRFDETGWSVTGSEGSSRTPYQDMRGVFETKRLWLLVCEKDLALLVQKKDLVSGEAEAFVPYLRQKISENKGEST